MTKEEWIWVAIRIFGIYLVVLAIMAVPGILSSSFMAYNWYGYSPTFGSNSSDTAQIIDKMGSKLFNVQLSELVAGLCKVLLFGGLGIYFLRSGKFVFRLISGARGCRAPTLQAAEPESDGQDAHL